MARLYESREPWSTPLKDAGV
ncbi:hypothetical protein F383_25072 [Gossypium arboreum]|uniref:Uncharacterized protein n=1 Tax=Gossypium arboreum TaxID=29729 RepID=A0A0B0P6C2_GOSAR|nr:hypothetical protein F383_25072 [Gossypium arboreum]